MWTFLDLTPSPPWEKPYFWSTLSQKVDLLAFKNCIFSKFCSKKWTIWPFWGAEGRWLRACQGAVCPLAPLSSYWQGMSLIFLLLFTSQEKQVLLGSAACVLSGNFRVELTNPGIINKNHNCRGPIVLKGSFLTAKFIHDLSKTGSRSRVRQQHNYTAI